MKLNIDDVLGCFSIGARVTQRKLYSFLNNKAIKEKTVSLKEIIPFFYKKSSIFDIHSDTLRKIINFYFKDESTQNRVMRFIDSNSKDKSVLSSYLGKLIKAQALKERSIEFNNSKLLTAILNSSPSLLTLINAKYYLTIRLVFDCFNLSSVNDKPYLRTNYLLKLFQEKNQDIIRSFLNSFSSLDNEMFIKFAQQLLDIDRMPADQEFQEDITELLHFTIENLSITNANSPMLFKFILVKGVDVNKQWDNYSNAYHHLCSIRGTKIHHAVWLIEAGAQCSDIVNFQGQTLIHSVARSAKDNQKKLELFEFFINAGIKSHLKDKKERTALDILSLNSIKPSDKLVKLLEKQMKIDSEQDNERQALETYDKEGKTPITPATSIAQMLGNFGIHKREASHTDCGVVSAESIHNEL